MNVDIVVTMTDKRYTAGSVVVCTVTVPESEVEKEISRLDRVYHEKKYTITQRPWITRKNLMTGEEYSEPANTPNYMSPASESYWSM